jgi:hypothetical protein
MDPASIPRAELGLSEAGGEGPATGRYEKAVVNVRLKPEATARLPSTSGKREPDATTRGRRMA